jgi:hypothetical protein
MHILLTKINDQSYFYNVCMLVKLIQREYVKYSHILT